MRIVFDLQAIQTESRLRGIGRYASSLVSEIARIGGGHDLVFLLTDLIPGSVDKLLDGILKPYKDAVVIFSGCVPVRFMDNGTTKNRELQEAAFSSFVSDLAPDVVLVLSPFEGYVDDALSLIPTADYRTGAVIYDLIPLIQQEDYLNSNDKYKSFYLDRLERVKQFDFFLSISEHTRVELINHVGVSTLNVSNIDGAVDAVFESPPDRLCDIPGLGEHSFILYTGGADPRKNLKRLLSAYSHLSVPLRSAYKLVLAGNIPTGERIRLEAHARQLHIPDDSIIYLGFVPDHLLRDLYAQCSLFVFPSYHEGLGLPVLEAMKCGAPVIAADATSLPELIGLPEALFDPFDTACISDKIAQALTDPTFRARLIQNSQERCRNYTWERTAKLALEAIENVSRPKKQAPQDYISARRARHAMLISFIARIHKGEGRSDDYLRSIAICLAKNANVARTSVLKVWTLPDRISWRLEGPFDSTYSLALLNREIARGLELIGQEVSLHSTEGPGDFVPNANFLANNTDLNAMYRLSQTSGATHSLIQTRNLYPPRVADMDSGLNLLHSYAWEESGFPEQWVEDFNDYLHGITCLSSHVQKILVDNGVTLPLSYSGCGVDHWERIAPDKAFVVTGKDFKFLHVSSCFPRKGSKILLEAYGKAFRKSDKVTLIIKTFPNPHNTIRNDLAEMLRYDIEFPDVLIIEENLSDSALKALYMKCDALVAPSFAEGFGLPMAEAMLSGLPVITTGWGGQTEFCNEDTAWLLDFEFQPAKTHFQIPNSVWAVPYSADLAAKMKEVRNMPEANRREKAARGRAFLLAQFTWRDVAERLVLSARDFSTHSASIRPKVGWVTTWQTRCGIAAYSENILSHWESDYFIYARREGRYTPQDPTAKIRFTWEENSSEDLEQTQLAIDRDNIDCIIVQINYGFFSFSHLARFIRDNVRAGRRLIAVLHSTIDPPHAPDRRLKDIVAELGMCDRVLVHTHNDLNRLKRLGLLKNVAIFPHGVVDFVPSETPKTSSIPLIATYGFFLPHKGLLEAIEAVHLLKNTGFECKLTLVNAEHPDPSSGLLIGEARRKIRDLQLEDRIVMHTDFLSDADSFALLSQADLLMFPYQSTSESSSAAVRYGLAVGKPVAVSQSSIFDDVEDAVFRMAGADAQSIADGIRRFIFDGSENANDRALKVNAAERWRKAHLYSSVSRRLERIVKSLLLNEVRGN